MSSHSDTLSWFRTNQSVVFLLHAVCLVEKQQMKFYSFCFTWLGLETTIYRKQGEHANHYTTDAV